MKIADEKRENSCIPIINISPPIRKLEDSEAAEQYCAEIGRPDAYMQLVILFFLFPHNFFPFLL